MPVRLLVVSFLGSNRVDSSDIRKLQSPSSSSCSRYTCTSCIWLSTYVHFLYMTVHTRQEWYNMALRWSGHHRAMFHSYDLIASSTKLSLYFLWSHRRINNRLHLPNITNYKPFDHGHPVSESNDHIGASTFVLSARRVLGKPWCRSRSYEYMTNLSLDSLRGLLVNQSLITVR